MARKNWSREETLMALAFYACPPPRRKNWDDTDAEVQLLARRIGRKETAVCFKIANLKACDPNRSGSGFAHAAAVDAQVMGEYLADPDETMAEAIWQLGEVDIQVSYDGKIQASGPSRLAADRELGLEQIAQVRTRVNQDYFRSVLLANYGGAHAASRASRSPRCSRRATSSRGRRLPKPSASWRPTACC